MEKKFLDESTLTYLRNYIDGQDKVIYKTAADLVSSTHLESLTRPATQPEAQVIPSITTTNEQQNLTIGDGLEIKDGALTTKKYVEANPTGTGTTDLTKLKVGTTIYNIPSGGGSATKMINLGTLTESGTIDADKLQELTTLLQNEDLFQVIFRYGDAFFVTASARNDLTSSDKDIYAVCVDAGSVAVVNLSISIINGNYTITTIKTSGGGSGSDVSVFDLTPYFNLETGSIGTEGYNALKDYITNNKCPIVRLNLDGEIYCFNVSVYNESAFICSCVTSDTGLILAIQLRINNNGGVTISQSQIDQVEGIAEQGTFNLKGLKVGGYVYNIPKLETYNLAINNNTNAPVPLKILACETTTEGKNLLRVYDHNFGIGHNESACVIGIVYKQVPSNHSGFTDLFTTNDGTFAILTANAEYSVGSNGGSGN